MLKVFAFGLRLRLYLSTRTDLNPFVVLDYLIQRIWKLSSLVVKLATPTPQFSGIARFST